VKKYVPLFKKLLVFITVFTMLNLVLPDSFSLFAKEETLSSFQLIGNSSDVLDDASENLVIYSSFYYQNVTSAKLSQISTDFLLPSKYGDVLIEWQINTSRILICDETSSIIIQTITGPTEIDVYYASIVSFPTVFQGNETFELQAILSYDGLEITKTYIGGISPVIPDDFWGGVVFTFVRYLSLFLEGVLTTLGLSLIGTIIGFVFALFLVFMRTQTPHSRDSKMTIVGKKVVNRFSKIYITIFRGTPMIVQASFFWYGLGLFGNAMVCGLFVVSINTAAYIAEILRGGITSVDLGQIEAARSLGFTNIQTMRYIVFPQAIKNSMPAIGNEFVINIKDTSVLSVIGIFELFNQTRRIAGMHYRQLEAYFVVALIYLFLTYFVTKILQTIEKKLDMPIKELTSSN